MSRIKTLVGGALVVAATYCAVSVYILSASLQTRDVCPPGEGPPSDLPMEAVALASLADGTRLAGWLSAPKVDRAVILLHGIDADAWAGAQPDLARAYVDAGFQVLLFDLRAHGRSGGARITLGNLERGDIRAAVDLVLSRGIPPGRIGLHGTSYGAAMSLLAAADIPEVGAVVADSAFADIRDLIADEVERRTRVPGFLAGSLMRPGIEVAARILYGLDLAALAPENIVGRISPRPVLFIHGEQDRMIPVDHAARLKNRAENPAAELWTLPRSGHTEGVRSGPCNLEPSAGRTGFLERVVAFFDRALPERAVKATADASL